MQKTAQAFGFVLATLGLFGLYGCNPEDKLATSPQADGPQGSALVRLPAVPQDYLAKTAAGSKAKFVLNISGEGMTPIQKSWTLVPGQSDSMVVTAIPSGYMRVFSGRLLRLDSASKDTSATHEGRDSVFIERNQTADVYLYLRKKGKGSAHVCVDIEGWPSDSTCNTPPPPPPPFPINVAGCWNLKITKKGSTPKLDSIFTAKLRINQFDSNLTGSVTWNSGASDSALGRVVDRVFDSVSFGFPQKGLFNIKATLDTTGIRFTGLFSSSTRNISGTLVATMAPCDTLVPPPPPPPPPVDSSKICFDIAQALQVGKSGPGRLGLRIIKTNVLGVFNWSGFSPMPVYNQATGSTMDSIRIKLVGIAPKGLIGSDSTKTDTLAYMGTLIHGFMQTDGVFRLEPKGFVRFGEWKSNPSPCTAKDI